MYVVISSSSGIIFFWSGPETTPAIQHGLLQLSELRELRATDIVLSLPRGSLHPRANFIAVSAKTANVIVKQVYFAHALLGYIARRRTFFSRLTLWFSAALAALMLWSRQPEPTPQWFRGGVSQEHDRLAAPTALAEALTENPEIQQLANPSGAVTPAKPIRLFPNFNDRFAVLPGHLQIPSSLTVTIEIATTSLYVRQARGAWTKMRPIKTCPTEGTHLFALQPEDLLVVIFSNHDPLPESASIATLPRSHRRPNACHRELGNPT